MISFPNGRIFAYDGYDEEVIEYTDYRNPIKKLTVKDLTKPAKILKPSKNGELLLLNHLNSLDVYRIRQEAKMTLLSSFVTEDQSDLADFEALSRNRIIMASTSGLVSLETIPGSRPSSLNYKNQPRAAPTKISTKINLSAADPDFDESCIITCLTVSPSSSLAVISTARTDKRFQQKCQSGLYLLELGDKAEPLRIIGSLKTGMEGISKKGRCYTHMRLYQSQKAQGLILLCFEGRYGFMEIFEKEMGPMGYLMDVYLVHGNQIRFLETVKGFHKGRTFDNVLRAGVLWTVDSTGIIRALTLQ